MLKKSITVFAAISSFVIMALMCVAFYYFTKDEDKKVEGCNKILCNQIFTEVKDELVAPILASKMMSNDYFLQEFLKNEGDLEKDSEIMKKYLLNIKKEFDFAQATLISARTYRYYRDDEMHKIINPVGDAHDTWFNQFEQDHRLFSLNVYKHRNGLNSSTMYVNYRLDDEDGNFLGVASPSVAVGKYVALFSKIENKYGVKIKATNASGVVTMASDFDEITSTSLLHLISKEEGLNYNKIGMTGFYASMYIPELDWYFVVRSTDRLKTLDDTIYFYLLAVFLFCLQFCALFIARKIFHGTKKIVLASEESIDSLTGLPNRNYFKEQFGERGLFNTTTYKCMAVFDIDYFKEANDNLNGNEALLSVVNTMSKLLENDGVILRWGGDEFVVLFELPIEKAYKICQTFCKEIESGKLITVSVGLTAINLFDTIKTNYHRAARYCYQVKELGGNGVKKD